MKRLTILDKSYKASFELQDIDIYHRRDLGYYAKLKLLTYSLKLQALQAIPSAP